MIIKFGKGETWIVKRQEDGSWKGTPISTVDQDEYFEAPSERELVDEIRNWISLGNKDAV